LRDADGRAERSAFAAGAAGLEAMFAFVPVEHFAITLGPAADIPLTGKASGTITGPAGAPTSTSMSSSLSQIGLAGGLLGYF
jgi:hypothetical protein